MAAVDAPRDRPRRTWPQRVLITFNCLLLAGCLGVLGSLGYFYNRLGSIPRVELRDGTLGEMPGNPPDPGGPQNYLLVGSDTREGQDPEAFGTEEQTGEARADTMILVRVDPRAERAAMVSFPRDLFVMIYSEDGEELGRNRINTAFEGGPDQLITTIRKNFDVPVHHYAQVNFTGFRDLVNAVGGVEMYLAGPVRDRDEDGRNVAGLDVRDSGCVTLGGDQALAYVRSRHFQQLVDERWQPDPRGDIGRIERQQDFIRRAVRAALSEGLTNPTKLNQLLNVADENLVVDSELDGRDVVTIGQRFRSLTPDTLDQRALVVEHFTTSAGAAVLRLVDASENEATFDIFRGIVREPEVVTPPAVQVRVLNGSGRPGEASATRDGLALAGFNVVGVGDDPVGTDVTTIRYGAGQEDKAQLVSRYLAAPSPRLQPDDTLTIDVVVTTGVDHEGVLDVPREPAGAPPPPPAEAAPAAEPEDGPEPEREC
jgi:polyisoprenyl-teichoic acid--peptidoglycan teichoic acid transferase